MRFSYQWLKEYLEVKLSASALAELLTGLGLEVENYSKKGHNDLVFELELTSNRPDCANMLGLAREIGAALQKKVKYPEVKIKEGKTKISREIKIEVRDSKLCPHYTARLIKGVKVGTSPLWLRSHLEKAGLRPLNNVVDATNFVLLELGHPLHAFDAASLDKNKLIIRRAKKGEKIITIDMVERKLSPDILVIADGQKPQAIAGIMGGSFSEVKDSTRDVLLESAYFNKQSIRRAAKKLNMLTESSYRFERGGDPEVLVFALNRAAQLIQELAGGEITRGIIDVYKKRFSPTVIELSLNKLNGLLGTSLNLARVKRILESLEFKIKSARGDKIKAVVPGFRGDVEREVGLIEEVARHYGYNKISATLPASVSQPYPRQLMKEVKKVSAGILLKNGLQEVINYSFINLEALLKVNLDEKALGKKSIKINNPISRDQDIMRPTLLPGLLDNIVWNFNRQMDEVKIFELGRVFYSGEGKKRFTEKTGAAFALAGQSKGPGGKTVRPDLFDLKGLAEGLLKALGISGFKSRGSGPPCFLSQNSAWIVIGEKKIGFWGEISPVVTERLGIKEKVFAAEIILDGLLPWINLSRHFLSLPKFPFVKRDLSLLVPLEVTSEEIISLMRKGGGEIIEGIDLFDIYQGEQVPDGFRSLGYAIVYRSEMKTLTDEEVSRAHNQICQLLENNLKIKIRGG